MIIPAVGSVASALGTSAGNAATSSPETLAETAASGGSTGVSGAGGSSAASEGLTGSEGVSGVEGLSAGEGASSGGTTNFGSALSEAISSLEDSQQSAATASQQLATGKVSDPEAAVTTVEDAALEMQLAAQIRTKAAEAAQTIFQTQV